MSSNGKKELMKLCRDINNGYFSPSTLDDIIKMAQLFRLCGKKSDVDDKNKQKYELSEKRACIHQVYLAHLSLIKYDLTDAEKLRCVREIIGAKGSVSAGYCLWAKYLHCGFESRDLYSIARTLLNETDDCAEKDTYAEHMKKIRFPLLLGSTRKYLPIKKDSES